MVVNDTISMGNLKSPSVLLTVIGLVILIFLMSRKIKGAVFIAIIATTIIGIPMGITSIPDSFFSMPPSIEPVFMKFESRDEIRYIRSVKV